MHDGTQVVWLEREVLFHWLDEHPKVAVDMLQVMAGRMRDNNERISDLVFMDVPARLAKTLINLASRFGEPDRSGGEGASRPDSGGAGAAGRIES